MTSAGGTSSVVFGSCGSTPCAASIGDPTVAQLVENVWDRLSEP